MIARMRRGDRWPGVVMAAACLSVLLAPAALGGAVRVGVADHRLVSQEFWIRQWADEWRSEGIVDLFRQNGLEAEVIGTDTLTDRDRLSGYGAIMIPTDHCYPDSGSDKGPVSKAIRDFVRSGGVYIMPMGVAHSRWKDIKTGAVSEDMGFRRDFLGLEWVVGADQNIPGPGLIVTDAGKRVGLELPSFPEPFSTYSRAINPVGEVFLLNGSDRPSLYMYPVGKGAVIHYAGGLPYSAQVRDYIVACYSAILKNGIDRATLHSLAVQQLARTRVYTMLPVAARRESGSPRDVRQFRLDGQWELAEATQSTADPDDAVSLAWIPVRMPNSIQNALFEAGRIENPWYAANNKKLQWISERDWCLRKRFRIPADWQGRNIRLRFDGMDYIGSVWLDGSFLGTHEGMLGGPTFDITEDVTPGREHEIMVRIAAGKGTSSDVIKPDLLCAQSFWGNKYWSIGLWQPVRVIGTGEAFLEAPLVRTESASPESADLWAQVLITNTGSDFDGVVSARILDPGDRVVWQKEFRQKMPGGGSYWEQPVRLAKPRLWWPNGMGDQPLYRLELSVRRATSGSPELDSISTRFGVRTIEVKRNPSFAGAPRRVTSLTSTVDDTQVLNWAWENADEAYRFLFVVNGRPFYAKGVSWLTSDDLLTLTPQREGWMIRAAKLAGVNLFRLNAGTSMFETEQFYNLCDENGILVWQELIFNWDGSHASSIPVWRDQLTQTVLRIRQHPSLAIYCGGNEFNPYAVGVTPFMGVAREIFDSYDNRPMRMSSPGYDRVGGTGGGTYHAYIIPEVWTGDPNWYPRIWDEGCNFVSEWSIYAYNNYSCLKRIIPKEELELGPVGCDFDAFKASHPLINVERYAEPGLALLNFWKASWYGDLSKASVADLSEYSQMGHAQTIGYTLEHWRAQFPHKGGETFWTYNIPQPANSWNIIDWFGQPLMAYYAMRRAHEPVHIAANTTWFFWGPGDTFKASVWALNDGTKPIKDARVTARVLDRTMAAVASIAWKLTIPAGGYRSEERSVFWHIPRDTPESCFFLEVTLTAPSGERLSQQVYWMKVVNKLADPKARREWQAKPTTDPLCKSGPWLKPQVESLPTSLEARLLDAYSDGPEARVTLLVTNTGARPAFPVRVSVEPDVYSNLWSDNFFWLAPGESRKVYGIVRLDMKGMDPITNPPAAALSDIRLGVSAWNAAGRTLVCGGK